jgi:hypothetical protein
MAHDAYASSLTLIQGAKSPVELKGFWQESVKAARAAKDHQAEKDFTGAKDKRKTELEAANAGH